MECHSGVNKQKHTCVKKGHVCLKKAHMCFILKNVFKKCVLGLVWLRLG